MPVADVLHAETAWILAMITGRRQEVETRGAVEADGFDDLQLRRENDTWIATVGRVEDGVDGFPVACEALGGVSCFDAVIERHGGDRTAIRQGELRDVVETVWFGVSRACSDVEKTVVDGRAAAARRFE